MGAKRGQAFETMMLVISVIVAIAILGVLLGFLGNVTIIGAEAKQVVPGLVKTVYSKGYGVETEKSVDFKEGQVVSAKDLTSDSFPIDSIHVECADDASDICGTADDSPIQITENPGSIVVNKATKASVAACAYPDQEGQYLVVIGLRNTNSARNKCLGA